MGTSRAQARPARAFCLIMTRCVLSTSLGDYIAHEPPKETARDLYRTTAFVDV